MHRLRHVLLLALWLGLASVRAEPVTVAVASNFTRPMQALAERFEAASGQTIRLAFGSSGRLYAQIRNGAPYDVFLSADRAKPRALEDQGLAVPGSRFTYALGTLALWSAESGRFTDGAALLRSGDFDRLAIANPRLAPYGVAAEETLAALGVLGTVRTRLVQGQNIAQAHQFVASGNADLGLVALSQLGTEGTTWVVPTELHTPIRQDAVLLSRASNNAAARALLDYLRSSEARALIETHGYRSEAD